MSQDDPEVLSVRTRKLIFGGFGWVFTAVAVLRITFGDVLFPLVFGFFAAIAFTLQWMTGRWWAELRLPPRSDRPAGSRRAQLGSRTR